MSRWLAFVPAAALAGVVVTGASLLMKGGDPHVSPDALIGKPLPASVVRELDNGAGMRLTTAVRGPALVNVFASWCAPCKAEQPLLLKLKADGVPIVGVAWKDQALDTKSFLAEEGDPFTAVVRDPGGAAGIDLGITGVPETFLVDRHGVVVDKRGQPLTEQDAAALEAKWRSLNDVRPRMVNGR
jgi:cytochrome c biogenesis protein CcmG/thiol:disulfide interchange protein DsbE